MNTEEIIEHIKKKSERREFQRKAYNFLHDNLEKIPRESTRDFAFNLISSYENNWGWSDKQMLCAIDICDEIQEFTEKEL